MSIQAIRKTGFLVEDPHLWGHVIGYLKCSASSEARGLAAQLDSILAMGYYEPLQPKLIVDEIEDVSLTNADIYGRDGSRALGLDPGGAL